MSGEIERVLDGWERGLNVDDAHPMDPTRRLIRELRGVLSASDGGRWDCSPDCERASGGVHHGCRFVRVPSTSEGERA